MKFVKSLSLVLALLMLAVLAMSCGGDGGETTEAPETTESPSSSGDETTKAPDTTEKTDDTTKAPSTTSEPATTKEPETTASNPDVPQPSSEKLTITYVQICMGADKKGSSKYPPTAAIDGIYYGSGEGAMCKSNSSYKPGADGFIGFYFDFGFDAPTAVSMIKLWDRNKDMSNAKIFVSDDNVTYTEIEGEVQMAESPAESATCYTVTFPETTSKYFRIMWDMTNDNTVNLFEIEAYTK